MATAAAAAPEPRVAVVKAVADRCIVTLKTGAPLDDVLSDSRVGRPAYRYTAVLNGFAAKQSAAQLTALRGDTRVAKVEAAGKISNNPSDHGGTPNLLLNTAGL